jgi:CBS domain-containing protein
MQVEQIMTRNVHFCGIDDSLEHAARLMWEGNCGCLPVVDRCGELVGVITDRDICMAAYTRGLPLSQLRVEGAMAHQVVICRPEDSLLHAERVMSEHGVRRLPVIGGHGQILGMLSRTDLMRAEQSSPHAHANETASARCSSNACLARGNTQDLPSRERTAQSVR